MPQYITDTALLKCDKGASSSPLTVTSQSFMNIEGKPQATEDVNNPMLISNLLVFVVF
ncbi:hypothetical protein [Chryseobacterium sp. Mn2064]|uniref:hypothetical protein n=1 Tax=Chryseobacterium sp. Mn2064 TaxID=3395263 RepID=UPI003BBDF55F